MPIKLSCRAYQRPIGQGGFYSADLRLNNSDQFTFVYDCGTDTDQKRLSDEISAFRKKLAGRRLNLLVISHLDADHVNGVGKLLNAVKGADYVFLPYLSPEERLIYALRHPTAPDAYRELLADPVAFLLSNGAREVYLVGDGDGDGSEDGNSGVPRTPDEDEPRSLENVSEIVIDLSKQILSQSLEEAYRKENGNKFEGKVHCVSHGGPISLSAVWKLRMFQKSGFLPAFAALRDGLPLPKGTPKFCAKFTEMVQEVLGKEVPLTPQSVLEIITDAVRLKALKQAYKEIAGAPNEVSLCLWHGPTSRVERNWWGHAVQGVDALHAIVGHLYYPDRYGPYFQSWKRRGGGKAGTLLTGDLNLQGQTLTKLRKHYADELPWTGMIQLPHHGSRHNTHTGDPVFRNETLFVSAGLRNKHTHPHLELLEEIDQGFCSPVFWSHERRGVRFVIEPF